MTLTNRQATSPQIHRELSSGGRESSECAGEDGGRSGKIVASPALPACLATQMDRQATAASRGRDESEGREGQSGRLGGWLGGWLA